VSDDPFRCRECDGAFGWNEVKWKRVEKRWGGVANVPICPRCGDTYRPNRNPGSAAREAEREVTGKAPPPPPPQKAPVSLMGEVVECPCCGKDLVLGARWSVDRKVAP
jgi:hypothetical protein